MNYRAAAKILHGRGINLGRLKRIASIVDSVKAGCANQRPPHETLVRDPANDFVEQRGGRGKNHDQ
eukprot:1832537-Amphidinium_carterae.1